MDLSEILHSNAAYRTFEEEAITDSELYEILDLARFAPSGGNRQGWHVTVVKDRSLRQQVREHYVMAWREYMEHVRAGLVPFAPDNKGIWKGAAVDLIQARLKDSPSDFADYLDLMPVLMFVTVEMTTLAVTDNGLGRQSIVGGASIYPFVYNLLLAARNKGFGGVMTTVVCREEQTYKTLLKIPESHAIAALVVLGKPKKVLSRLKRASVESFCTVDSFEGPPLQLG